MSEIVHHEKATGKAKSFTSSKWPMKTILMQNYNNITRVFGNDIISLGHYLCHIACFASSTTGPETNGSPRFVWRH